MELMKHVVFLDCSSEDTMLSAQSYSVLWTLRTGSESVLLDQIMIFISFTVILCFYKRFCVHLQVETRRLHLSKVSTVVMCFRCNPELLEIQLTFIMGLFRWLTRVIVKLSFHGRIFGFVARKAGSSMENVCHLFAEHDPEQPASAIVNFVSKVMIGSQKMWCHEKGVTCRVPQDQQISSNELKARMMWDSGTVFDHMTSLLKLNMYSILYIYVLKVYVSCTQTQRNYSYWK